MYMEHLFRLYEHSNIHCYTCVISTVPSGTEQIPVCGKQPGEDRVYLRECLTVPQVHAGRSDWRIYL